MKLYPIVLWFLLLIFQIKPSFSQVLLRGPYLQKASSTSIVLRWNTNAKTIGTVKFGTDFKKKDFNISEKTSDFEHKIQIDGLKPNTKYFYSIEANGNLIQGDEANYFYTSPEKNAEAKIRMVAFGDCGTGTINQLEVVSRVKEYFGNEPINGWLLLGDNAYNYGFYEDYNERFFKIYDKFFLKNTVLWPAPGNHDYADNSERTSKSTQRSPYFDLFSIPIEGESGGLASKNEAYYSFDYGNVHFLSLDSYGKNDGKVLSDTASAQMEWIKKDLKANKSKWTVVYFHHPPYTMGSHNSDNELDLVALRQNLVKVLEANGVDLVLNGHSHNYERSFMIKNHLGMENSFDLKTHAISSSSGKYDDSKNSCPYIKSQEGTVYVVSGSSGWVGSTQVAYPHNAMVVSNSQSTGALILEVEGNRFEVKFLTEKGEVFDKFTILKDVNKRIEKSISCGEKLSVQPSWKGFYKSEMGFVSENGISIDSLNKTTSFKISDTKGCIADTITIKVDEFQKPSASSNSPRIEGEDLIIKGKSKSNGLLTWTGPNNFNSKGDSVVLSKVSLAQAGKYILTLNFKNCISSDTLNVEIKKILALENSGKLLMKSYPNPSDGSFIVEVDLPNEGVFETMIVNSEGKIKSDIQNLRLEKGINKIELNLEEKGLFYFVLRSNSFNASSKIILK